VNDANKLQTEIARAVAYSFYEMAGGRRTWENAPPPNSTDMQVAFDVLKVPAIKRALARDEAIESARSSDRPLGEVRLAGDGPGVMAITYAGTLLRRLLAITGEPT
jgi:hypothetical protein